MSLSEYKMDIPSLRACRNPMKCYKVRRLAIFLAFLVSLLIIIQNKQLSTNEVSTSLFEAGNLSETPDHRTRRLPGALIIGSRKCGTRALLKFLEINLSVRAAKSEVHFFDRQANYEQGLEWYKAHLPASYSNELTIEKSPAYFVADGVPAKVQTMNPNIKLILIVRDPVVRLISDFSQIVANRLKYPQLLDNNNNNNNSRSGESPSETLAWLKAEKEFESMALRRDGHINDDWRPIKIGMYSRYLESWLKFFPMEQLHIVDGEAMIKSPYEQLRDLELFLNLNHTIRPDSFVFETQKGFFCVARNVSREHRNHLEGQYKRNMSVQADCLSRNKGRRHVQVRAGLVKRLRDFYAPYNEYLYSLIGKDFGWN